MTLPDTPMADRSFTALRAELLKTTTQLSCHQLLDLADLFHAVIRMRRRHRPLDNLNELCRGEQSWPPRDDELGASHSIKMTRPTVNINHNL